MIAHAFLDKVVLRVVTHLINRFLGLTHARLPIAEGALFEREGFVPLLIRRGFFDFPAHGSSSNAAELGHLIGR